ncbi:hypothetical protein [Dactylosporangium sp. CA-233914]|uniref:hypothetical protein n=1 Tax=Dactylosporangium sp. CA-233914 TaxID=3239934 RepID=UPI003D8ADE3A
MPTARGIVARPRTETEPVAPAVLAYVATLPDDGRIRVVLDQNLLSADELDQFLEPHLDRVPRERLEIDAGAVHPPPSPAEVLAAADRLGVAVGPVPAATDVVDAGRLEYRDGAGAPTLRPFAVSALVVPSGVDGDRRARKRFGLHRGDRPGTYRLAGGWVVEVFERGLWVRPAAMAGAPPAELTAESTVDDRPVLVYGAPGVAMPQRVRRRVDRLRGFLPSGLRELDLGTGPAEPPLPTTNPVDPGRTESADPATEASGPADAGSSRIEVPGGLVRSLVDPAERSRLRLDRIDLSKPTFARVRQVDADGSVAWHPVADIAPMPRSPLGVVYMPAGHATGDTVQFLVERLSWPAFGDRLARRPSVQDLRAGAGDAMILPQCTASDLGPDGRLLAQHVADQLDDIPLLVGRWGMVVLDGRSANIGLLPGPNNEPGEWVRLVRNAEPQFLGAPATWDAVPSDELEQVTATARFGGGDETETGYGVEGPDLRHNDLLMSNRFLRDVVDASGEGWINELVTQPFRLLTAERLFASKRDTLAARRAAMDRLRRVDRADGVPLGNVFGGGEYLITEQGNASTVSVAAPPHGRHLADVRTYNQFNRGVPLRALHDFIAFVATTRQRPEITSHLGDALRFGAAVRARAAGHGLQPQHSVGLDGYLTLVYLHAAGYPLRSWLMHNNRSIGVVKSYVSVLSRQPLGVVRDGLPYRVQLYLQQYHREIIGAFDRLFSASHPDLDGNWITHRPGGLLGHYFTNTRQHWTTEQYLLDALLPGPSLLVLHKDMFSIHTALPALDEHHGRLAGEPLSVVELRRITTSEDIFERFDHVDLIDDWIDARIQTYYPDARWYRENGDAAYQAFGDAIEEHTARVAAAFGRVPALWQRTPPTLRPTIAGLLDDARERFNAGVVHAAQTVDRQDIPEQTRVEAVRSIYAGAVERLDSDVAGVERILTAIEHPPDPFDPAVPPVPWDIAVRAHQQLGTAVAGTGGVPEVHRQALTLAEWGIPAAKVLVDPNGTGRTVPSVLALWVASGPSAFWVVLDPAVPGQPMPLDQWLGLHGFPDATGVLSGPIAALAGRVRMRRFTHPDQPILAITDVTATRLLDQPPGFASLPALDEHYHIGTTAAGNPARAAAVTRDAQGVWRVDGAELLIHWSYQRRMTMALLPRADFAAAASGTLLPDGHLPALLVRHQGRYARVGVRDPAGREYEKLLDVTQVTAVAKSLLGAGGPLVLASCEPGAVPDEFAVAMRAAWGDDVLLPEGDIVVDSARRRGDVVTLGGRAWRLLTAFDDEPWDVVNDVIEAGDESLVRPFDGIAAVDTGQVSGGVHLGGVDDPGTDTPVSGPASPDRATSPDRAVPPDRAALRGLPLRLPAGTYLDGGITVLGAAAAAARPFRRTVAEHAGAVDAPLVVAEPGTLALLDTVLRRYRWSGSSPVVLARSRPDPWTLDATHRHGLAVVHRGPAGLQEAWIVRGPDGSVRTFAEPALREALRHAAGLATPAPEPPPAELAEWLAAEDWSKAEALLQSHAGRLRDIDVRQRLDEIVAASQEPRPAVYAALLDLAAAGHANAAFRYLRERDDVARARVVLETVLRADTSAERLTGLLVKLVAAARRAEPAGDDVDTLLTTVVDIILAGGEKVLDEAERELIRCLDSKRRGRWVKTRRRILRLLESDEPDARLRSRRDALEELALIVVEC